MTHYGPRREHRSERAQKFKVPGSKFKEAGSLVHIEP
jgi:hypothetical protein